MRQTLISHCFANMSPILAIFFSCDRGSLKPSWSSPALIPTIFLSEVVQTVQTVKTVQTVQTVQTVRLDCWKSLLAVMLPNSSALNPKHSRCSPVMTTVFLPEVVLATEPKKIQVNLHAPSLTSLSTSLWFYRNTLRQMFVNVGTYIIYSFFAVISFTFTCLEK